MLKVLLVMLIISFGLQADDKPKRRNYQEEFDKMYREQHSNQAGEPNVPDPLGKARINPGPLTKDDVVNAVLVSNPSQQQDYFFSVARAKQNTDLWFAVYKGDVEETKKLLHPPFNIEDAIINKLIEAFCYRIDNDALKEQDALEEAETLIQSKYPPPQINGVLAHKRKF